MSPRVASNASPARIAPLAGVEAALGVTRVARLTGLDRTGVEVGCAMRPAGHVLQVANGKGTSWAAARASAVGEAAELWASERVVPEELRYGTPAGLRARGFTVWDGPLGSAGDLAAADVWTDQTFAAFRAGQELFTRATVLIPAGALHCPPPGAPPIGPMAWRWTTNGLGAHATAAAALQKALLEAVERSELARSLPNGFTESALRQRALSPASWPRRLSAWGSRLGAAGFDLLLCDLTPARGLGLPVVGALLLDREGGPQPVSAGYACHFHAEQALEAATLEAAQSRLTDIHGGRDDVAPMAARDVARLRRWVRALRPQRSFRALPHAAAGGVAGLLRAMHRAGHRRAAAVTLSPPGSALVVIKVVVPSFGVSELL